MTTSRNNLRIQFEKQSDLNISKFKNAHLNLLSNNFDYNKSQEYEHPIDERICYKEENEIPLSDFDIKNSVAEFLH